MCEKVANEFTTCPAICWNWAIWRRTDLWCRPAFCAHKTLDGLILPTQLHCTIKISDLCALVERVEKDVVWCDIAMDNQQAVKVSKADDEIDTKVFCMQCKHVSGQKSFHERKETRHDEPGTVWQLDPVFDMNDELVLVPRKAFENDKFR